MKKNEIGESVLDFPKEGLDSLVWAIGEDGKHNLTSSTANKIQEVIDYISEEVSVSDFKVNITGSITSNCYSDDSDIDLHFNSPSVKKEDADEMNVKVRAAFDKFKAESDEDDWLIGSHPLEVYYQGNPFQDLMSVGCYSFTEKRWLVGPELQSTDFNPFEEYYNKDMKYVNKLIGDIRALILEVYEKALVADKFEGEKRDKVLSDINTLLGRSFKLFTDARNSRKHLSEPHSEEEAKKLRNDKKWKIADSAFKLLDKFGYLAILKEYASQHEQDIVNTEKIIEVVRQNLGFDNKKLHELENEDESSRSKKVKMWVDDIRQVPEGYTWFKTTNDAIAFIEDNGPDSLEVIDIDHDAGDFQNQGGDYIRILDFLEFIGAKDLKVRIHSANAVGIENMRRIIRKNAQNGWKEVFDIMSESANDLATPQYDRVFNEIKKMISQVQGSKLGVKDELNRGNKCIKLWCGDVKKDEYGFDDYSSCDLAYDPKKSWGLVEVITFPQHEDLTATDADEAIEIAKEFINKHSSEQERIDEGPKELLSLAAIAGILAIPGTLPAQVLAKNLKSIPRQELRMGNDKVSNAITDASTKEMIGSLSKANTINALARTIYAEAKGEGEVGQDAVASVILNRAGGDPAKMIAVISKKWQFSCWNDYKGSWVEGKYQYSVPAKVWIPGNKSIWQHCVDLATRLVERTFESTIGNENSYMNKATASKKNVDSWGKYCTHNIGNHSFGYLSWNDGYKSSKQQVASTTTTYVVKAGDTLSKIAKQHGVQVSDIIAKNNISNPNNIKVGQTINV